MPDIRMCHGGSCPKKDSCYRFMAVPNSRQSFLMEAPYERWGFCDKFIAIEHGDDVRRVGSFVVEPAREPPGAIAEPKQLNQNPHNQSISSTTNKNSRRRGKK